MAQKQYETQRLILLPSQPAQAGRVAEYYTRNRRFLEPYDPARSELFYTVAGQRSMLAFDQKEARAGQGARFWLQLKGSDDVIGMVALNNIVMGSFRSAYVAYKLDERYLRQGYITEALQKLIQIAFGELRLHRLEANILPRNTASLGVAHKLGFENEGISRQYLEINGVWEDHARMVLINNKLTIENG